MKFHVRYFYLATGMEGRPDERDYGLVEAGSSEDAKRYIAWRETGENWTSQGGLFPTRKSVADWMFNCLTAIPNGGTP